MQMDQARTIFSVIGRHYDLLAADTPRVARRSQG